MMLPPSATTDATTWAEATFGTCLLNDRRRTARVVRAAASMLAQPGASLPQQAGSLAALKALYRVMDEADVQFVDLVTPHWEQSRAAAALPSLVLLVQDTTTMDYTGRPAADDLGPIGDGRGQGYFLHSVLAVEPQTRDVLGLVHQAPFVRTGAPEGEHTSQRLKRERESQVWSQAVDAVGHPPSTSTTWVHVGDRGSDLYPLFAACAAQQVQFLVRACQNRRVDDEDATRDYLMDLARRQPAQAVQEHMLPASHGQPARVSRLQLAWAPVTLLPPMHDSKHPPLPAWVLRVWEADPPVEVTEPVEWVLITSVPTTTAADAWKRVTWYTCRWMIEDFHQCLKTGCRIEQRKFETRDRLWRLLGLCAPIAVRLLQLRQVGRHDPERLATTVVEEEVVHLVAAMRGVDPATMTVGQVMREIARFGGYLGRRQSGPPGWKTLWQGWLYVHTLLDGVRLAHTLNL